MAESYARYIDDRLDQMIESNNKFDKAMEILQAFKDGKKVDFRFKDKPNDAWTPAWNLSEDERMNFSRYDFRISKDPKYRPYANAEEFLKDSIKHHNWIISSVKNGYNIIFVNNEFVGCTYPYIVNNTDTTKITFKDLLNYTWFDDGSVCGVLVTED